ncbi:MAG: efflux RND transporter periplasmic adaptor subunit [Flavobacteriales bacterium]
MSKRKKRWIWISVIIVSIVGISLWMRSGDHSPEITTEKAAFRDIVETVSASGKIQPEAEVKIQSEVSGQIIELPVKEGDFVTQGQLLVKINPDLYNSALSRAEAAMNSAKSNLSSAKARLAQAEAQFKSADLNFRRQQKLFQDGAISKAEMDNTTSQYETAQAEVTAAQESIHSAEFAIQSAQAGVVEATDNLKRTTILAPMSGTVTSLTKEPGETVLGNNMMSGDVIMKISALSVMEVNVEVNESDIVRVQMGDTAHVEVDAYKDVTFTGIVTEIGNTALNALTEQISMDQVTNFSVKVRIMPESYSHLNTKNQEHFCPFKPGMSATVEVISGRADHVLSVPIKCIASREDTSSTSSEEWEMSEESESASNKDPYTVLFIYRPDAGKTELRVVKTGIQDDEFIQIENGIQADDVVITGPYDLIAKELKNGDAVRLKLAKSDPEP